MSDGQQEIGLAAECYYCGVGVSEHQTIHVECKERNGYKWAHRECLRAERQDWLEAHGEGGVPEYAPDWVSEVVE